MYNIHTHIFLYTCKYPQLEIQTIYVRPATPIKLKLLLNDSLITIICTDWSNRPCISNPDVLCKSWNARWEKYMRNVVQIASVFWEFHMTWNKFLYYRYFTPTIFLNRPLNFSHYAIWTEQFGSFAVNCKIHMAVARCTNNVNIV